MVCSQGIYLIKRQTLCANINDYLCLYKCFPKITEKWNFVQYGTVVKRIRWKNRLVKRFTITYLIRDIAYIIAKDLSLDQIDSLTGMYSCKNKVVFEFSFTWDIQGENVRTQEACWWTDTANVLFKTPPTSTGYNYLPSSPSQYKDIFEYRFSKL